MMLDKPLNVGDEVTFHPLNSTGRHAGKVITVKEIKLYEVVTEDSRVHRIYSDGRGDWLPSMLLAAQVEVIGTQQDSEEAAPKVLGHNNSQSCVMCGCDFADHEWTLKMRGGDLTAYCPTCESACGTHSELGL